MVLYQQLDYLFKFSRDQDNPYTFCSVIYTTLQQQQGQEPTIASTGHKEQEAQIPKKQIFILLHKLQDQLRTIEQFPQMANEA